MKRRVREAVIVEGRYDKNAVSQVVDGLIIETSGFGIFSDGEKLELIRQLARRRGVILFTDPDGAGFVIRNYLKGALGRENVKQAYIPDIRGRERRKKSPSKEGLLGVEGVGPELILSALERAGATFEDGPVREPEKGLTKYDLYELGLSGRPDSAARREALCGRLGLPKRLSANALLEVLNILVTREELIGLL